VIKRSILFTLWSAVGVVLGLELLYAFTPFGLPVLLLLGAVLWQLDRRGLIRSPEAWGLLAGPGLFSALVAASADDATAWLAAAGCFVGVALGGFIVSGRARCTAGGIDAA
jgi:hypothetical protein